MTEYLSYLNNYASANKLNIAPLDIGGYDTKDRRVSDETKRYLEVYSSWNNKYGHLLIPKRMDEDRDFLLDPTVFPDGSVRYYDVMSGKHLSVYRRPNNALAFSGSSLLAEKLGGRGNFSTFIPMMYDGQLFQDIPKGYRNMQN